MTLSILPGVAFMIAPTRRRHHDTYFKVCSNGIRRGLETCGYLEWHWIIDYHELGLGSGAATFDYVNSADSA